MSNKIPIKGIQLEDNENIYYFETEPPVIGENGNWIINGTDSGYSSKGDSPFIKEGYWWIGEYNTGIEARGPQGEQGIQGPAGKDGSDANVTKANITEALGLDVEKITGKIFDHFPNESELWAMRDAGEHYFTIRSSSTNVTTNRENVTFYVQYYWEENYIIRYSRTNPQDSTKTDSVYVFPINTSRKEIYLPYYGIKNCSSSDNIEKKQQIAESNSDIIDRLVETAEYGTIFKFPSGHFFFSRPIDFGTTRHISIIGVATAGFKHRNISGTTFLHFENLQEGETALTVSQCTLSNFTIMGGINQYNYHVEREDGDNDLPPHPVAYENYYKNDSNEYVPLENPIQAIGIKTSGGIIIKDIGICNFYSGLECDTSNVFITGVSVSSCHYGVTIGSDTKIFNLSVWDVAIGLKIDGSLASVNGMRGDSIGEHLVQINAGGNHTLTDLDADFCMNSIICIGDGQQRSVSDLNINGVHGRSGASHLFNYEEEEEITAEQITSDTAHEFGVISVRQNSELNGAVIITNQRHQNNSPYDYAKKRKYRVPYILLSAANLTKVNDVQFIVSGYNINAENDLTDEQWLKQRIHSTSTQNNACNILIHTSNGYLKYIKNGYNESFIKDVKDIYDRMDKSSLALKNEVVLTVNGYYPDKNGNVSIIEQPPEEVDSKDSFIPAGENPSKKYVLDGYIWAQKVVTIPAQTNVPQFTNQLYKGLDPSSALNSEGIFSEILDGKGYREHAENKFINQEQYSINNRDTSSSKYSYATTGLIPIKNNQIIRINKIGYPSWGDGIPFITWYSNNRASVGFLKQDSATPFTFENIITGGGKYSYKGHPDYYYYDMEIPANEYTTISTNYAAGSAPIVSDSSSVDYFAVMFKPDYVPIEEIIITVDEEIKYIDIPEQKVWEWYNTGEPFVKPDYEGMINETNERIDGLEERVETLEEQALIPGPQGPAGPQGEPGYTPVKGTDYWTEEDKQEIVDEIGTSILPQYVMDEAEAVIDRVIAAQSENTFVLGAMSDLHYGSKYSESQFYNNKAVEHACQAMKYIDERIKLDAVAILGDYTDRFSSNDSENALGDFKKINSFLDKLRASTNLRQQGNHDFYSEHTPITHRFIQAYSDDVVWGSKIGGYYYKDFEDYKLRIISINTTETANLNDSYTTENIIACSTNQYNWFAKSLDLTDKNDAQSWQILILSHHPLDWGTQDGIKHFPLILKAYTNGEKYESEDIVYDFTEVNYATIVGNIHGHIHNLLYGAMNETTIYRMCTSTVGGASTNHYDNIWKDGNTYVREENKATETGFCIFCINLKEQIIDIIKYGIGSDRNNIYYVPGDKVYTIRYILDGVTSTNTITEILPDQQYTSKLETNEGIVSIQIVMGDEDVTKEVTEWNDSGSHLKTFDVLIPSVTDNITIMASGADSGKYVNTGTKDMYLGGYMDTEPRASGIYLGKIQPRLEYTTSKKIKLQDNQKYIFKIIEKPAKAFSCYVVYYNINGGLATPSMTSAIAQRLFSWEESGTLEATLTDIPQGAASFRLYGYNYKTDYFNTKVLLTVEPDENFILKDQDIKLNIQKNKKFIYDDADYGTIVNSSKYALSDFIPINGKTHTINSVFTYWNSKYETEPNVLSNWVQSSKCSVIYYSDNNDDAFLNKSSGWYYNVLGVQPQKLPTQQEYSALESYTLTPPAGANYYRLRFSDGYEGSPFAEHFYITTS